MPERGPKSEPEPEWVRVCDVNEERVRPPYSLALARAMRVKVNGRDTLLVAAGPEYKEASFLLTSAAYACEGNVRRPEEALVLSAGVQYGCSAHACPNCVYATRPHVRNLRPKEVADLFRLALHMNGKGRPALKGRPESRDERRLELEFTENGEPLGCFGLPEVLDELLSAFGVSGRVLGLTISTVFLDNPFSWMVFATLRDWQAKNRDRARLHLRVSRPMQLPRHHSIIGLPDLMTAIEVWGEANPQDRIAIVPALVLPSNQREFNALLNALEPIAGRCLVRITPAVLVGSQNGESETLMSRLAEAVAGRGFAVTFDPSAAHMAEVEPIGDEDWRFYDPATYTPWRWRPGREDPNI